MATLELKGIPLDEQAMFCLPTDEDHYEQTVHANLPTQICSNAIIIDVLIHNLKYMCIYIYIYMYCYSYRCTPRQLAAYCLSYCFFVQVFVCLRGGRHQDICSPALLRMSRPPNRRPIGSNFATCPIGESFVLQQQ